MRISLFFTAKIEDPKASFLNQCSRFAAALGSILTGRHTDVATERGGHVLGMFETGSFGDVCHQVVSLFKQLFDLLHTHAVDFFVWRVSNEIEEAMLECATRDRALAQDIGDAYVFVCVATNVD